MLTLTLVQGSESLWGWLGVPRLPPHACPPVHLPTHPRRFSSLRTFLWFLLLLLLLTGLTYGESGAGSARGAGAEHADAGLAISVPGRDWGRAPGLRPFPPVLHHVLH